MRSSLHLFGMLCWGLGAATEVAGQERTASRALPSVASGTVATRSGGDFVIGDRILVTVDGGITFSDTFSVRTGQVITLPKLPDISLSGVHYSELQPYLAQQIGTFLNGVSVRAELLRRVGIIGRVAQPGYYWLSADTPISDAIMVAGGFLSESADPDRTTVRRQQKTLRTRADVSDAVARGVTLEGLGVRSGDQIVVGSSERPILRALGNGAVLVGSILLGAYAAANWF